MCVYVCVCVAHSISQDTAHQVVCPSESHRQTSGAKSHVGKSRASALQVVDYMMLERTFGLATSKDLHPNVKSLLYACT